MKQDRNGVRTAQDIERKYNLSELISIKKAVEHNEDTLNKTNAELENFMSSTLESIDDLQHQLDGSITTYYYSGEPTLTNYPTNEWLIEDYDKHIGNMYYDKDTGYAYRFFLDGDIYRWIKIADSDVEEAMKLASEAKDTADGKRRVFTTTPFVPYDKGDLWLSAKELYVCVTPKTILERYSLADFELATKYTDDTNLNDFVNNVYPEDLTELTNQIDSKVTTWYYSGEPTLNNEPANNWSQNDYIKHTGDLYYDKDTGYTYTFQINEGVYSWIHIIDSDLTDALAKANAAQDTADNKRRIFLAPPLPPYDNGDLWLNNGEILVCQISKLAEETYVDGDFIIATKYTDDTLATQVGDELQVLRGTVTTIKESTDEYKIQFDTTIKTIQNETKETIEALETMSYSFGTKDLQIANSNDPVNTRINNQGLKVYTYKELETIVNHNGLGTNKLIVVGDAQIANLRIVKAVDENGRDCTDFHHLISTIQDVTDLE